MTRMCVSDTHLWSFQQRWSARISRNKYAWWKRKRKSIVDRLPTPHVFFVYWSRERCEKSMRYRSESCQLMNRLYTGSRERGKIHSVIELYTLTTVLRSNLRSHLYRLPITVEIYSSGEMHTGRASFVKFDCIGRSMSDSTLSIERDGLVTFPRWSENRRVSISSIRNRILEACKGLIENYSCLSTKWKRIQ